MTRRFALLAALLIGCTSPSASAPTGSPAASATLGPIIPPSLPFVIYGMMAGVSITPEPSAFAIVTLPALAASTRPATPRRPTTVLN